jgi:hypothetical protein
VDTIASSDDVRKVCCPDGYLQRNKLKVIFMSKVKMRSSVYTLEADLGQIVGWGIRPRSPATVIEMTKVRVVIKYAEFNNMPMYILTAFPIL